MRVSMAFNAYAAVCGSFASGEVEDYTVNISSLPIAFFNPGIVNTPHPKDQSLSVYPNPANDVLNISFEGEIQTIQVISTDGSQVPLTETTPGNRKVDISTLRPGLYILMITSANQFHTARFIKS